MLYVVCCVLYVDVVCCVLLYVVCCVLYVDVVCCVLYVDVVCCEDLFMHFCPGTITSHAESINSDLQRGLDRRLRHIKQ